MSPSALRSTWQLEELRQKHRDGKLPASVDAELTRVHGPAWAEYRDRPGYEKQWWINAEALKAFRSGHGRWPVLTRAGEEKLAAWRKNQRHTFEEGKLRADRREWLDENAPGWLHDRKPAPKHSPHRDQVWQENASALKAFRDSHRRWPGTAGSHDELTLSRWRWTQRSALRHGWMRHDRRDWLDQNLPGWAA